MTIYFEVLEKYSIVKPGIYSLAPDQLSPGPYMTASNRAWDENNGNVIFAKHPNYAFDPDMKEFFWIKMRAKAL